MRGDHPKASSACGAGKTHVPASRNVPSMPVHPIMGRGHAAAPVDNAGGFAPWDTSPGSPSCPSPRGQPSGPYAHMITPRPDALANAPRNHPAPRSLPPCANASPKCSCSRSPEIGVHRFLTAPAPPPPVAPIPYSTRDNHGARNPWWLPIMRLSRWYQEPVGA